MPITFSHLYSFADYRSWVRAAKRPTLRTTLLRFLVLVALLLVTLAIMDPGLRTPEGWRDFARSPELLLLTAGICAILGLLARFDYVMTMWLGWFWYRRLAVAGKQVTVTLDDAALTWAADGVQGRLEWQAIKRVVATASGLLLFIGALEGLVMPRRAFPDEDAYRNAVAFVTAHVTVPCEQR